MKRGKLYLIPIPIAPAQNDSLSQQVPHVISHLSYFAVENVRTARRFISSLKMGIDISQLKFEVLDKNTDFQEITKVLAPLDSGTDVGIMSEAGCPGIADPGSKAVAYAHKKGIEVIPLVGPSSIVLALMGSGFNGQSFAFHGYLPINKNERKLKIKELEKDAARTGQTQIFMDTPYRNNQLLSDLLSSCQSQTLLSIASNITAPDQYIKTKTIDNWRKDHPDLHKVPVIFSLFAN